MATVSAQELSRKVPLYVSLWCLLRVYTSLGAVLFSAIRPITSIEQTLPIWPPAGDMGLWLNRVFLAPWLRWDAVIYVSILRFGYHPGDGSTSFHPLYAMLSKPLYLLGVDPLLSLVITSSLAILFFFWIFYKLAALDLSPEGSSVALVLLASSPLGLILFAPYTESVFLFFSTLALYKMRLRRWPLAAFSTCLASLARQQGVLLAFPMLWYAWEDSGRSLRGLLGGWRGWLAVCSVPAGLMLWTAYRLAVLHEGVLDTHSWHGFVYSALLSNSAKSIVPEQAILWPWQALAAVLPRLMHGPDIADVMSLALGVGFVVLLALAWRRMQPAGRLYSLVITLTSFSLYTGAARIYMGLPRHLLLAVPVFVGLAGVLKARRQQIVWISLQLAVQIFMLFLYVTNSWIP